MAAAPVRPKPKGKRVYLVLALVGLTVLGYLWLRSRAPAAASSASPAAATSPAAGTTGAGSQDSTTADLLGALAGENQDLVKSFLASEQGLVSLVGSSFGAPTQSSSTPVAEPAISTSTTSAPLVSQAAAVDPQQARAAAALGVSAQPYQSLEMLNTELAAAGLPTQSYPDTISSGPSPDYQPATVTDPGTTAVAPPAPAYSPPSSGGSSGAAAVKAGTEKTNFQAKTRALK